MPKTLGQCCADLLGQGQRPLAAALAGPQAELPHPPVQVVELKGGDLASAQAEARQPACCTEVAYGAAKWADVRSLPLI